MVPRSERGLSLGCTAGGYYTKTSPCLDRGLLGFLTMKILMRMSTGVTSTSRLGGSPTPRTISVPPPHTSHPQTSATSRLATTEQRPANNVEGNNHSLFGSGEKYKKCHDADSLAYARAESNPVLFVPAVGSFMAASEEGMAMNSRFLAAMFNADGKIISRATRLECGWLDGPQNEISSLQRAKGFLN